MAKSLRSSGKDESERAITLALKRHRAGGVDVIDVEVRSGPREGQRARIIPTNSSSAYFNEELASKVKG